MVESKNCPNCNTPLKDGFIAGSSVVWWTNESPGFLMREKDGNVQLDKSNTSWAKLPAKRCVTCKLIFAYYDK